MDNYKLFNFIIKNKNVTKNKTILNNLTKNLLYISLRIKAYNVYKKDKITVKGVSNYFVTGNLKLNTIFINKY